ncbi:HpcH/HpaI aldolase family protein [Propylenella binzhouense]|uniref:Aldolase n=1 Tax=Propylenella binzhouense TaxID=2555902 RepID=A0A964T239_9HYPH|nr:aldolase/citrate lyase family protein [Propylenella binzhouense]MYZ46996.1 aldolase [Propylenella binzhouense]
MTATQDIRNPLRDRMSAGEVGLGMVVRLARSGEIARIAKASGHDFIFVDGQHAIFSAETIGHIAQAALGCGIATLVRARNLEDPEIPRLLDNGVMGVVFPDVNNAAEARRAVQICKFAPVGKRSVAGGYSIFDFKPKPIPEAIRILNETTLVVCMIETPEGLENVEAIAAVEGVDVVHIGCNDLLNAWGTPGAFGEPRIMAAIGRIIEACRKHGKWAGLGGDRDLGRQTRLIHEGVRFITTQTDVAFLMAEASRRVSDLRRAAEAKG